MENLDVNYLNELRRTFNSAEHQNKALTKKQKHKSEAKTTLRSNGKNTDANGDRDNETQSSEHKNNGLRHKNSSADHQNASPTEGKKKLKNKFVFPKPTNSGEKIKNRIDTPFKLKKTSLDHENRSRGTKAQLSKSEHENNALRHRNSSADHRNEAPTEGKKKLNNKFIFPVAKNSSEKIKNRIDTPFKQKKTKQICRNDGKDTKTLLSLSEHDNNEFRHTLSNQTEASSRKKLESKISEATKSNTKLNRMRLNDENLGRGTKRRLSTSEAEQEVKLKKKKERLSISKGVQLNFSEEEIVAKNSTEDEGVVKKKKAKISKKVQLLRFDGTGVEKSTKEKGVIPKKIKKVSRALKADKDKAQKSSPKVTGKKKRDKFANLYPVMPSEKKKKIKRTFTNEARQNPDVQISKINRTNRSVKEPNYSETAHDFCDNEMPSEKKKNTFANEAQQNLNFQISKINKTYRSVKEPNCSETAHDFYDDDLIATPRNFPQLCDWFTYLWPKHFIEDRDFEVPKKFYQTCKGDNHKLNISALETRKIPLLSMENVESDSEDNTDNEEEHKNIEPDEATISDNEPISEPIQTSISSEIIETNQLSPVKIVKLTNNDQIVIIPEPNELIHFCGLFNLKVLNGQVEILGATLTETSPHQKIYSPRGTSLLYIKNTKDYCKDTIKIKNLIASDLLNVADTDLALEQHSAILLCQELKEPYIDFIESHMPQILFPEATLGPRVDFEISGIWNKTLDYSNLSDNCMGDSKTVICGGKGVGKSTFLRYLVNTLLGKFPKVRIVDLDSGQSEFFAPGFIGIVTVGENVLGPNYTHIQPADVLILSHINIAHDIQRYSKCVKHLTKILDKMPPMPTLINFPGYTQGLGLELTVNSLKLLQPHKVIEIKSKNRSKNYKTDLTSDNVNSYTSMLRHEEISTNYEYVKFDSRCEKSEAWALEARPSRELSVLAYFGQMMSEATKSLTCHNFNMFCINISALSLVNFAGNAINPLVVNGCLVALCSVEQEDLFIAYGLGLVRGLDLENDSLVLLTPEKDLEKVTHLVLTSVGTPPSLLMSASGLRGKIPFVNEGELVDFGQFTKRTYLPPAVQKRG